MSAEVPNSSREILARLSRQAHSGSASSLEALSYLLKHEMTGLRAQDTRLSQFGVSFRDIEAISPTEVEPDETETIFGT